MNSGINAEYGRPQARCRSNGQMIRSEMYPRRYQGMGNGNRVPPNGMQPSAGMQKECGCQNRPTASVDCGCMSPDGKEKNLSLGMAYVPVQKFQNIYPEEEGFQKGTLFSQLNFPFLMTKCARGCGRT